MVGSSDYNVKKAFLSTSNETSGTIFTVAVFSVLTSHSMHAYVHTSLT